MESNEAQERDWSSLPPDVLNLIAKKVGEITDFVRFRAVCTSWCSSTPVSSLPPQFPWIFRNHINPRDLKVAFYSIPLDKFYNFHTPNSFVKEFFVKEFKGPSEGYIYMLSRFYPHQNELNKQVTSSRQRNLKAVFADIWTGLVTGSRSNHYDRSSLQNICGYSTLGPVIGQLSLFNPLNNHEFILPAYDFGEYAHYIGTWQNQLQEYVICYGKSGLQNLILVSWRPGQDNWHEVNLDSSYVTCSHFYLKRMLYSVERATGITIITDIATGSLVCVVPPIEGYPNHIINYLVEASGDILRVIRYGDQGQQPPMCKPPMCEWFDVYKLDENKNGSPCWVKVTSIGDHALFIDLHYALTLEANDSAMIKRNSIYFMRLVGMNYMYRERPPLYDVKIMNIDTGAIEYLARDLSGSPQWFVPNLHHL
ncbi:hypothetical protein LUZ61_008825 [Rhynchospora tenuis]|uniref:KIB1-4 beta-propeller domain-containing protein n=1 Tax=Rhynchospora tenuis TaxID=198213 RepID=A0AAD5ZW21_9POAL|nr:hypothetical protein LUZ61_008825 [Rhynchospora tenuis]